MSNYTILNEYKQQVADYFNARTNYDGSEFANRRANRLLELLHLKQGYIEVTTEQFGKYILVEDAKNIFDGSTWIHPENPLLQLSLEQKEQLKVEFASIIECLATDKGVWHDITTFFVLARK